MHILVVEDNPGDARLVREMLDEEGSDAFVLTVVPTVKAALQHLGPEGEPADAILLDLSLPDESGVSTVQRVVAGAGDAVVVVMTGAGDEELGMAAMEAGAQDYLVKGQVDSRLLRRALRFAMSRQTLRQQLQDWSHKDELTGLHNRRGFLALAEQNIRLARRQQQPFLLIFMDLDDLKTINDTLGHSEGNRALIEAADVLRGSLRQSDILARFGGDEFGAFCLCSGDQDGAVVRARIATALAELNRTPDRAYALHFSIGVLRCSPQEDAAIETLLERADQLMYQDKKNKKREAAGSVDEESEAQPGKASQAG
jgi:diguanylate cyclase (GGDEF)-like protein